MSQIVIKITDRPNNRVEVQCQPLAQTLIEAAAKGHHLTSAEGYALHALRSIREESAKMQENTNGKGLIIQIPRLRG